MIIPLSLFYGLAMTTYIKSSDVFSKNELKNIENTAYILFGMTSQNDLCESFNIDVSYKRCFFDNISIELSVDRINKLKYMLGNLYNNAADDVITKIPEDRIIKINVTTKNVMFPTHVISIDDNEQDYLEQCYWYMHVFADIVSRIIWNNYGTNITDAYYDKCCKKIEQLNNEHMNLYNNLFKDDYGFSIDNQEMMDQFIKNYKKMVHLNEICKKHTNRYPDLQNV